MCICERGNCEQSWLCTAGVTLPKCGAVEGRDRGQVAAASRVSHPHALLQLVNVLCCCVMCWVCGNASAAQGRGVSYPIIGRKRRVGPGGRSVDADCRGTFADKYSSSLCKSKGSTLVPGSTAR